MAELYDIPVIGRISLVENQNRENSTDSFRFVARMKNEGYKIFAQTNESIDHLKKLVIDYLRKRKDEYLSNIFKLDGILNEAKTGGTEKIFEKYQNLGGEND